MFVLTGIVVSVLDVVHVVVDLGRNNYTPYLITTAFELFFLFVRALYTLCSLKQKTDLFSQVEQLRTEKVSLFTRSCVFVCVVFHNVCCTLPSTSASTQYEPNLLPTKHTVNINVCM